MTKLRKLVVNCAIVMFLVMSVLVYIFYQNKDTITSSGFTYNQQNTSLMGYTNDVAKLLSSKGLKDNTATVAQNITKAEYNSTQCKHRQVKLSERRLPLTGLLSFPGSGNTWTRHLIQQMTGIGTSSVYCDSGLRSKGFPFECNRELGKTIVVKAHDAKDLVKFQKIILLVRNPYDALLSYATYSKGGHTKIPNTNTIVQASNNMFNDSLRWFISLPYKTCSTFRGPIYILQYDLLKADLQTELEQLAQFLNISVPQADIECTVRLQEGNFHRKSSAEDHLRMLMTVYDNKKLEQLRTTARKTESILEKHFKRNFYLGGDTEYALFGK